MLPPALLGYRVSFRSRLTLHFLLRASANSCALRDSRNFRALSRVVNLLPLPLGSYLLTQAVSATLASTGTYLR